MAKSSNKSAMREKNPQNMADPLRLTSAISAGQRLEVADPLETRMNKGFPLETLNDCDKSLAYPPRPIIPESVLPAKAAELTDWGLTTIKRHCRDGKFKGAQKTQIDGNDSWQIPVASLPPEARAKYGAEVKAAALARAASIAPLPPAVQERSLSTAESGLMFDDYQRSGAANKARAEAAHVALSMFHELVNQGYSKGDAEKAVIAAHKVSRATLHRYRAATDGHPVSEWLPRLAPKFSAGRPPVEFSEEAYAFIYGSYLNTSKTPLTVIMVRARALAKSKGWVIPSNDAVRARLAKEPRWALILGREGPKALEQSQPPVKRDYTGVAVNEIWCSDGHRLDLFTRWPDGTVERMFLIAWIDIRSRAILGVKVYSHPNAAGVLAAFGAAMQRTRTAPDLVKIDNGMEYAAKSVTGGQANRYRNKVVPGEPIGLLTHVGTKVHWSEPGRGQDKPIESFWNFLIDYLVKLPEFEGAYCGPNTASKPEGLNAAKHAVPIAVVEAKLEQSLRYFNTEHKHRGDGMNKRTPQQVYEALVSPTPRNPVDAMYIEMCNHGAAQIKPDRSNVYALTIPGYGVYRYWSEELACLSAAVMGHKHNIYYDMDNPLKPVLVFDGKGFLGKADYLENIAFREIGGERSARHKREKKERMEPQKAAVKQIKTRAMQMMAPLALPATSSEDTFSRMPVTFEAKRSPELLPTPELDDPWKPTGKPGELMNQETGGIMRDRYAAAASVIQATPIADQDDEEQRVLKKLAELARQVSERKRLLRTQTNQSQDY